MSVIAQQTQFFFCTSAILFRWLKFIKDTRCSSCKTVFSILIFVVCFQSVHFPARKMPTMSTLTALAKRLYEDREHTGDIVFVVDSERINAHRCILAALSPKYKAQFYGSQPDGGEIVVSDISAEAFKVFIRFFYGKSTNLTLENITEILNLAKQCLVERFVDRCSSFLKESICASNLCWIYRLAILYELKSVRTACEANIRASIPRMFKTIDFLRCQQNVLIQILKIEPVSCDEWEILKGCIAWAQGECVRKGLDNGNPANLRAVLGPAIDQIRFNSFSINQFAKFNVTYKGFFTLEEFQEITNIIANLKDFKSKKFNQRSRKRPASADITTTDTEATTSSEDSDYSS